MSGDIKGLVETSLNLGIIECTDGEVRLAFSIRSAKGVEKEALCTRVTKTAEEHGATHSSHGAYPAWEYRKDSHLRDVMCETYERMYGKSPKVITIHAGLECGLFAGNLEGLEAISLGCNIKDLHTPAERMELSSYERIYRTLLTFLKK